MNRLDQSLAFTTRQFFSHGLFPLEFFAGFSHTIDLLRKRIAGRIFVT